MLQRMLVMLAGGFVSLLNAAEPKGVEVIEKQAVRYLIWRVEKSDLGRLEMHWLDANGQPLGNFDGLRDHLAAQGLEIEFATNAGIYERGPKPCGLTVCQGNEVVALNPRDGDLSDYAVKPTATTVFRPQTYAAMFALVRRR